MNKKPNGFVCHHTCFLSDKQGLQMKSQTNAGKRSRVRAVFFFFWYRKAFKSVSAFKNSSRTQASCESITRDGRGLHLQNAVRSCVMAATRPHRIFPALS